ncbi:MAG: phosphatidylglycerophosphatase A, partial [Acidobacteriota bacterium]|nr:phosphatidylglycerophosphatase A [Acidobacteriota bacterium]
MSEAARPRTRWAWAVATFLGVGLLRPGPGTYGSVAAVLVWLG